MQIIEGLGLGLGLTQISQDTPKIARWTQRYAERQPEINGQFAGIGVSV